MTMMTSCIQQDADSAKAATEIADRTNQHNTSISKNPLAFIADIFKGIAGSGVAMIAAVFIFLIIVVFAFLVLTHHHHREAAPTILVEPPAPPLPAVAAPVASPA